tara:strand:+ start:797 stop:1777 length:981 start_codon:yes stop_codon:yes gene_type:complete
MIHPFNKLETVPKFKSMTWVSHTYCNYSCDYCVPEFYNGKYRWKDDFTDIINLVKNFRKNSPLRFDIMGGEPTLWPKFSDLCKKINDTGEKNYITFSTNGSRTINWWKKFDAPTSEVVLSFHIISGASISHFIEVIKILSDKGYRVIVFLMMHPKHFKSIKKSAKKVIKLNLKCNLYVKLVSDWKNMEKGGALIDGYTQQMKDFAVKIKYEKSHPRQDFWKYLCLHASDSKSYKRPIDLRDLINQEKNSFKGWMCATGIDYIGVESNGDIYGSQCRHHGKLGNIHTGYTLPKAPQTCYREFCNCGSDLEIYKFIDRKADVNTSKIL